MKRIIIIGTLLILLAAGGFFGYSFYFAGSKSPRFKTEAVSSGSITSQVVATGTVNPVTLVQVGSQVSGTIQKLFVDFNSVVREGQIIALIDPALFQAKVDQCQADLINAKAVLENQKVTLSDAQRTLERYKSLYKDNLVARNDLDQAQVKYDQAVAAVKTAEAQIGSAKANLASAKTNLNYSIIRSPVNGTVVNRNVDVGQTVAASLQAPTLFTIAQDLTNMQVDTNVDEADIGRMKTGQTANFTVDSYPGETFTAQVFQVRNAATTVQNVVTYDVVLRVKNPDLKLKPGMTANVSIVINEKDGVLKIPNAALRFKMPVPSSKTKTIEELRKKWKGWSMLWIYEGEKKPRPTFIKPGISDGKYTEIAQGRLKEGDQVITEIITDKEKKGPAGQQSAPRMRL
ncbi:MAG TPA: efflux RND transporter periplasmic adaptor subunit [Thermodesulfobacteriota bacterium]|nr:efflux RND transporter periplasmic adaptor subunit [Thermodesulfobacteriota bacterium]